MTKGRRRFPAGPGGLNGCRLARSADQEGRQSHAIDLFQVKDPEAAARQTPGNALELYYELPDALEMFARGRNDRDVPLFLDR